MRRRVFVIAGEYAAHPRSLPNARRDRAFLSEGHPYPLLGAEYARLFFRHPRARGGWEALGTEAPVTLGDLLASAGHRALSSLATRLGDSHAAVRSLMQGLFVTAMPGLDPHERVNIGLLPQRLRGLLALPATCRSQFLVGTSDSGAWAFAEAVRTARTAEEPTTVLVTAGQLIPSGYQSQYQIRSVLGENDQALGFDMLAVGDLWMDVIRRGAGVPEGEIESMLALAAARKHAAAALYPAAMRAGAAFARKNSITRWFDETDVAPPCCGAAAAIVTSDESLVSRIAEVWRGSRIVGAEAPRDGRPPIVEVLGVGDGSSNPNFLERRSPLFYTPAVRQALAAAAADAGLSTAAFATCAFGVLHDAFPSIELSFLLSIGLDFAEARRRVSSYWSNPMGGLCTFGHAIGASGLVQVAKTFHVFCADRRYVLPGAPGPASPEPVHRFPDGGALSFTSSVGGPLSHVVVALFRGGGDVDLRGTSERRARPRATAADPWPEQRRLLRRAQTSYFARVDAAARELGARTEEGERVYLVEGTTTVSIRSCLVALDDASLERLTFDGVVALVQPEFAAEARADLRETIRATQALVGDEAQRFEVFDTYHDALAQSVRQWRDAGYLTETAAARPDDKLTEEVKARLSAPLVVLSTRGGAGVERSVHVLPLVGAHASLDAAALAGLELLVGCATRDGSLRPAQIPDPAAYLPFWNPRGRRAHRDPETFSGSPDGAPYLLVGALVEPGRTLADERNAELDLLRTFFAGVPSQHRVERAAAALRGVPIPEAATVPVLVCVARVVATSPAPQSAGPRARIHSNGRPPAVQIPNDAANDAGHASALQDAVSSARGWLAHHEVRIAAEGSSILLRAFVPDPVSRVDAARSLCDAGVRFTVALAAAAQKDGLALSVTLALGDGRVFHAPGVGLSLATNLTERAHALLPQDAACHLELGDACKDGEEAAIYRERLAPLFSRLEGPEGAS